MRKKRAIISHCSQCCYSYSKYLAGIGYSTYCRKLFLEGEDFLYHTEDEEKGFDDTAPYSTPIPGNCPLEDAD